ALAPAADQTRLSSTGGSGINASRPLSTSGAQTSRLGDAATAAMQSSGNRDAAALAAEATIETQRGGEETENRVRIIANRRNNALLIYATPSEYGVIEGMLRKIDIIPLQVLIEATIAEVTLNDQLQYGTQFFFKIAHVAETLGPLPTFPETFTGFALSKAPTFI